VSKQLRRTAIAQHNKRRK